MDLASLQAPAVNAAALQGGLMSRLLERVAFHTLIKQQAEQLEQMRESASDKKGQWTALGCPWRLPLVAGRLRRQASYASEGPGTDSEGREPSAHLPSMDMNSMA